MPSPSTKTEKLEPPADVPGKSWGEVVALWGFYAFTALLLGLPLLKLDVGRLVTMIASHLLPWDVSMMIGGMVQLMCGVLALLSGPILLRIWKRVS